MSETKRWECCGKDWTSSTRKDCTDSVASPFAFCPMCGKPRPAPEAAQSEDERLALELLRAWWGNPGADWRVDLSSDGRMTWLKCLSKARSLLEPDAYERGKQDGRREAYENASKHCADNDAPFSAKWCLQQRDACGPAKQTDATKIDGEKVDEPFTMAMREMGVLRDESDKLRAENERLK